jgi:hypothetical protein
MSPRIPKVSQRKIGADPNFPKAEIGHNDLSYTNPLIQLLEPSFGFF